MPGSHPQNLTLLLLQGTAGDINPRDNGEYITGEKLASEVIAVLDRPMNSVSGPISFFLDTINIPVSGKTKEEMGDMKCFVYVDEPDLFVEAEVK